MTLTIIHSDNISIERVRDVLTSALEGGSNYWYEITAHHFADGVGYDDVKKGGRFNNSDNYYHPEEIIPTIPGCCTLFNDRERAFECAFGVWVNLEAIQFGFQTMVKKYPAKFLEILMEEDDSETADLFLQTVVFGEVIYG